MSTRDKILMRKIKKREKNKSLKLKAKYLQNDENEDVANKETVEIPHQNDDTLSPKNKKTKHISEPVEEESLPSGNRYDSDRKRLWERQLNGFNDIEISSDQKFSSLEGIISEATMMGIKDMGYTTMTEIQAKTIPLGIKCKNIACTAKTGSGKTLAYLIPTVELIYKLNFKPWTGTGAIVLSPTRELAMQTYGVLMGLMKHHRQTFGLVMGGASKKAEAHKFFNGISILVATPGRLLYHLKNTPDFLYKNLLCLVIDEIDRILDGFEDELKEIIRLLPQYRQTMLFSATKTKKTEDLYASIKQTTINVGMDDEKQATVDTLTQGFVICPSERRFALLYAVVKQNWIKGQKVMVFFSTCNSVKYHHDFFNYVDVPVMYIHGKQEQAERTRTFFKFSNADSGILFCTDVAARGLDIPAVDLIIQYDPPDDPQEYIHRVGRTARGLGTTGKALMFLRQEEYAFLRYLKHLKVRLSEYGVDWDRIPDKDMQIECLKLIRRNSHLNQCAKEALKSYLRAYKSYKLKSVFNITNLDLIEVAKSFGLTEVPQKKKFRKFAS